MENTINEYNVTYYDATTHGTETITKGNYKSAVEQAKVLKTRKDVSFVSLAQVVKTIRIIPESEWLYNEESCRNQS